MATYDLVVSGIVSFNDEDKHIEEFLLSHQGDAYAKEAVDKAVQELEEEAAGVTYHMKKK